MFEFLSISLRMSTPLVFAALGGVVAEASGIVLICLEGGLLIGAFVAAVVAYATGSLSLGVMAAMVAVSILFLGFAFLVERFESDAIILGTAVNFVAFGVTPLLTKNLFETPTNTPAVSTRIVSFFGQSLVTWLALLTVVGVHFFLSRTKLGLRIRACGFNPLSCEASGVSKVMTRQWALLLAGAMTALGGVFLSIGHSNQFTRDMTAGRGFIALACVLMGRGRPFWVLGACLIFGAAEAFQIDFDSSLPSQWIQAFPYLCTLFFLFFKTSNRLSDL